MRHLIHVHKPDSTGRHTAGAGTPVDSLALLVGGFTLVAVMGLAVIAGVVWMLVVRG